MIKKEVSTAVSLMRMALALLDKAEAGASTTACHLQAAIDMATEAEPSLRINDTF